MGFFYLSITLITVISLSGCGTSSSSRRGESDSRDVGSVGAAIDRDRRIDQSGNYGNVGIVAGTPARKWNYPELVVRGVRLQSTQFDYPVTLNSRVEFWIDYFLGRGRPHFEKYLERSELFIPYITPILVQNGMPEDLVYLAMIESGFNNHARSSAKAVGPWQFISATGKRYGLMVNWWVDERRDTQKSTMAAVGYLRDLYSMFGSWELAAAAYNAGEAKVARAIQRFGTKDFWTLSRQRFLRQETRDYVPKIIAAAILAKNRTQFGFQPSGTNPHKGEVVAGDGEVVPIKKADAGGREEDETIAEILTDEASNTEGAELPGHANNRKANFVAMPLVDKKGVLSGEQVAEFEVESPSDLLRIAEAAGLSYQTVRSLNPEILRWCTPPEAATYRVKLPASTKDQFLSVYNSEGFQRRVQFLAYKAKRGDSIQRIASRFGLKAEPVLDLNGYSAHAGLREGTKVLLPLPLDRSRSIASLDVRDAPDRKRRRIKRKAAEHKINYKTRQNAEGTRVSLMDR